MLICTICLVYIAGLKTTLLSNYCSGLSTTASLFEGHQLSLEYLVRNLLKLYVDIEFTGSHTQVGDMLNVRLFIYIISEFLTAKLSIHM